MVDQPESESAAPKPSKKFAALLYLPLMIPGAIPLYFAATSDDGSFRLAMLVFGVLVLILNALLLVTVYRRVVEHVNQRGS